MISLFVPEVRIVFVGFRELLLIVAWRTKDGRGQCSSARPSEKRPNYNNIFHHFFMIHDASDSLRLAPHYFYPPNLYKSQWIGDRFVV
jgi:hypothetical protein